MANSDTRAFVNDITLRISPKRISTSTKSCKKIIMDEIIFRISALFNSGGGQLTLDFEEKPCTYTEVDNCFKTIEQRIRNLTSVTTVSNLPVNKSENEIIMTIPAYSRLIVVAYNLYLPEECEVVLVPPDEPVENVKNILQGDAAKTNPTTIKSHCKQFIKNRDVGFGESKVAQLKFVKTEATKHVTVAKRICGKTNKFCSYVSAFGNHSGGHIYVGVNEDGIVIGENLCEKDKDDIVKEVTKTLKKMVWPNHMGEPIKGTHFEVFFEPVRDNEDNAIPSLFVVVVFIAQCPGGVFAENPESYHIVNTKVVRMSYNSKWLSRFHGGSDSAALQVPAAAQPSISSGTTDPELHGAFAETPESTGQVPLPSSPKHESSRFQEHSSFQSVPLQVPSDLSTSSESTRHLDTPERSRVMNGQVPLSNMPDEQSSHSQVRSSSSPLQAPPVHLSEITDQDSDVAFTATPERSRVMNGHVPLLSMPDEQSSHFQNSASSSSFTQAPRVHPNSSEITNDFTEKCKRCRNNENRCEKDLSDLAEKEIKNPRGNAPPRLLVLPEKVIIAYKKHNFEIAKRLLEEFEKQLSKSSEKDAEQFRPKAGYLNSCLECAQGNYESSFEIATRGLKEMELIHPEVISRKDQIDFYLHTAMLATILYCKRGEVESFAKIHRAQEYLKRAQEYLKKATTLAEVSKVAPDLLQKLHIYKACVLLRCSLTGEAHSSCVSEEDINTAISKLLAVERIVLEGHPLSHYRKTQFLLVKSDLFYRRQFDYKTQLKCAYEMAQEGKALATKYHFKEMALYASKRMAVITEKIIRVWHFLQKVSPKTIC